MILALSLLLLLSPAQTVPEPTISVPPEQATQLETALAGAFEHARAAVHLRHLTRIPNRPLLRAITCSAALNGKPILYAMDQESEADSALVETSAPTALSPDLLRVASYDDRATGSGRKITRYALVIYPSATDPTQYWVGLALYWSHFTEGFSLRMKTHYGPDLRDVVPACLNLP